MKKVISVLLVILLCVGALVGCGGKKLENPNTALSDEQIELLNKKNEDWVADELWQDEEIAESMNESDWDIFGDRLKELYIQHFKMMEGISDPEEIGNTSFAEDKQYCLRKLRGELTEEEIQASIDAENAAKARNEKINDYYQIAKQVNVQLEEMTNMDEYSGLIDSWSVEGNGIDGSFTAEIEFMATAEIIVGQVSAIRNVVCDVVVANMDGQELGLVNVHFANIGTYTFTVGAGWDREVQSSDSE